MLKIKDNVDLKELEKYRIYPVYECNSNTGETRIREYVTDDYRFEKLRFVKKRKRIAGIWYTDINECILKLNNVSGQMIDIDTLYDLIKDGLVEKVN